MDTGKKRITFEEARALYPDEWVVFSEPRMNMESTTFIDGIVYFHGKDHDEALDRSAEVEGDAAVDFTGTRHYEKVIRREAAQDEPSMTRIVMHVPDVSLLALKLSPEAFTTEIRLAAAVKLFELGRLSSGTAAKLAGIPRTVFLSRLGEYGVNTFDLSREHLEAEADLG